MATIAPPARHAQVGSPLFRKAHQLDRRVRSLGARRRRDLAAIAETLLEIRQGELFRLLGYSSMTAYGRSSLDLGASTTSELLKIVDACQHLPQTRIAFSSGSLPVSKAKLLVEVATPENEHQLLKKAAESSPEQLRAEIRDQPLEFRQSLRWTGEEMAWVDDAVNLVRQTGGPTSFAAALAEACRRLVTGDPPEIKSKVRPFLVIHKAPDGTTTRETSRGPVPADEETEEWARREGKVIDLNDPAPEPPKGDVKRHIPQVIRDWVLTSHGARCCVPACTNRAFLEADHLRGWGKGHDPRYIVPLCWQHHRDRTRGYLVIKLNLFNDSPTHYVYLADGTYLGGAGDRFRADRSGEARRTISRPRTHQAARAPPD